jgi:hypothetical protein
VTMSSRACVRWYGRVLEADSGLVMRLPAADGPPTVRLRRRREVRAIKERPIYRSGPREEGAPWLEVFEGGASLRVHFSSVGDFELTGEEIRYRLDGEASGDAEVYFLGLVSALWLERQGAVCLHASAVALPAGAVGFLGFNRAGKSSLAAGFLAAGYPLVTDDVLALNRVADDRVEALPSFPQMRLWPISAESLVQNAERLEPIHPDFEKRRVPVGSGGLGTFVDRTQSLEALFVLDRGERSTIEFEVLSPRAALIELVRHSFLGALGDAVVGTERRFERLIDLARSVPMLRLSYPHGLELLPNVCRAILERVDGE